MRDERVWKEIWYRNNHILSNKGGQGERGRGSSQQQAEPFLIGRERLVGYLRDFGRPTTGKAEEAVEVNKDGEDLLPKYRFLVMLQNSSSSSPSPSPFSSSPSSFVSSYASRITAAVGVSSRSPLYPAASYAWGNGLRGVLTNVEYVTAWHQIGMLAYLAPLVAAFFGIRVGLLVTFVASLLRGITYSAYYDQRRMFPKRKVLSLEEFKLFATTGKFTFSLDMFGKESKTKVDIGFVQ